MKAIKIVAVLLFVYVGIVVLFESLLGYFQPANQSTLVITTTAEDGTTSERVLARLEYNGALYVATNHWPRSWYTKTLTHPEVHITSASEDGDYLAIPVTGAEHDSVNNANALGTGFRILTGFPARYFFRLEPR